MRKFILLLAFIGILNANDESAKVVIDLTTANLKNIEQKILGGIVAHKTYYSNKLKELDVAVIIHGGSYKFFLKDSNNAMVQADKALLVKYADLKKRLTSLANMYEVDFLMCASGMKKHEITTKDLMSFVKTVPNAGIGLIDKQNQGFAYLPVGD